MTRDACRQMILAQKYFHSRNTVKLAKSLLGKYLVRRYRGRAQRFLINEVEAYDDLEDKASHAHRGRTARNSPMFGPAGHWYVYFTYGMHWMLNIVTGPKNYPAAILIRGIRGNTRFDGPARLTKFLNIDKKLNGKPANKKSGLWIESSRVKIRPSAIRSSPRIGVHYAGPIWSKKKLRFYCLSDAQPTQHFRDRGNVE